MLVALSFWKVTLGRTLSSEILYYSLSLLKCLHTFMWNSLTSTTIFSFFLRPAKMLDVKKNLWFFGLKKKKSSVVFPHANNHDKYWNALRKRVFFFKYICKLSKKVSEIKRQNPCFVINIFFIHYFLGGLCFLLSPAFDPFCSLLSWQYWFYQAQVVIRTLL